MKEKASRKEINELIKKAKSAPDFKKIKRQAMRSGIKLDKERKKFCKFCYSPLKGKIRIKKGIKSITCENCNKTSRWKI